jgi:hypothetical protein
MKQSQPGSRPQHPVCSQCNREPHASGEAVTFYVHLQDGSIQRVEGVTGHAVTETEVVLRRGESVPVSYSRTEVYYACCDRDMPPPQS